MSPEELEATREGANVDYAPDIAYEDWQAMARALLAHIDSQAAQISALKEKLVEERAQVFAGKGNLIWEPLPDDDRPDGLYPALVIRGKAYWRTVAHQQIEAEMVGVEWE